MRFIALFIALSLAGCASPGGIGVLYNKKGVVKYVFEASPADAAGMEVEDLILNPKELRGKIGTVCHVRWQRGAVLYQRNLIRVDADTFRRPDYGTFDKRK